MVEAQKRLSDSANAFVAQEKARYSNEIKKIGNERRKALEKAREQAQELDQLQSELAGFREHKVTAASGLSQQLEDITGRFHVLETQYKVAQREIGEKRSLASRLTQTLAEHETAKSKIAERDKDVSRLTQEVETCKTAMLKARAAEERATAQAEETRNKGQSGFDDLRRSLSQAEEKSRYAEVGLAQMKSSAEKTILEEQEKHRKQREALQQRLTDAQNELQLKTEEANDIRAFVERTVQQQQALWQKSYADLDVKAAEYKAALEEKCRLLEDAQAGRDSTQAQVASLRAEIQQQQKHEADRQSRQKVNGKTIDDLRKQRDAAQAEVTNLQANEQLRVQMETDRQGREETAQAAVDNLQRERDEAKAVIASLQASEGQRRQDQDERNALAVEMQNTVNRLRSERDLAQNALKALQARDSERRRPHGERTDDSRQPALQPSDQRKSTPIIPPKISDLPAPVKQRKKADRTTNTIVRPPTANERNEAQQPRRDALPAPTRLTAHAQPATNTQHYSGASRPSARRDQDISSVSAAHPLSASMGDDEMLDRVPSRQFSQIVPESQLVNSTQAAPVVGKTMRKCHAASSQTLAASLDFSGNPRIVNQGASIDLATGALPSQASRGSSFQIYEDPHEPQNDRTSEEDSVRANFTFRKPFPMPNSGSKRLSRTTSDKSLESRVATSLCARHTPENTVDALSLQRKHTPEIPKYPFGSSPEFMNPPSIMVKRRYSGPNTPGDMKSADARRLSTPLRDPRVAARAGAPKRRLTQDDQPDENVNEPPAKKPAQPSVLKAVAPKCSDEDSFLARSSQSVNDLPRIEGPNPGRNAAAAMSSRMRISGGTTRTTRNQAKNSKGEYLQRFAAASSTNVSMKDQAFKDRFSQELRRR